MIFHLHCSVNFARMEQQGVFISLGSNMGNRLRQLSLAVKAIGQHCGPVVKASSVYETEPWGFDAALSFFNQVISIEPILDATALMECLLEIEQRLGRKRVPGDAYTSRLIDLDLLYFQKQVIETEKLILPHPRLHLRRFVLVPLTEISPDFNHPVLLKSHKELLSSLSDKGQVSLLPPSISI